MKNKLKLVKNLLEKRSARKKEGLFVIEGPHLIEEAGDRVKFYFYCENLPIVKKLEEGGSIGYKLSRKQFTELSQVEAPQGIIAVVRDLEFSLNDVLTNHPTIQSSNNPSLIIYCIGVQDPGNLGTIIRTADALGATGIILSKGTVDLYNPKVVRSTQGSIFHLPIVIVEDDQETIEQLKQKNVKIIVSDIKASRESFSADLTGPIAFLIGNEGAGLPGGIFELADEMVKIPMPGRAESLNAGISAGILLYEALRQRNSGR